MNNGNGNKKKNNVVKTITVRCSQFFSDKSEMNYVTQYPNDVCSKPWFIEVNLTKPTKRSPMGIPFKFYDFEWFRVHQHIIKEMGLYVDTQELFQMLCNVTQEQINEISKLKDYKSFMTLKEMNPSQQRVYFETIGPKLDKIIYDYLKFNIPINQL